MARTLKRPPVIRVPTQLGYGSREYRYAKPALTPAGPGDPPPGFLGPTVSATEWQFYWALAKIFGNPPNPWEPPFTGGEPDWTYQQPYMHGRAEPMGAVVDFIVWRTPSGRPVGIRIQTEYWHLFTTAEKQASDYLQRERLESQIDVVDVFDYMYTEDTTGETVIQIAKAAIGLIQAPDPLRAATARRNQAR